MNFIQQYSKKIAGKIEVFDRILIKGHLPLSCAENMDRFMSSKGCLLKNFKYFVSKYSQQLKDHAWNIAKKAKRPYLYLSEHIRKEEKAREIAATDNITEGLVCIFSAVEKACSFRLEYGKGRPRLVNAMRKCLCLYFYFIDKDFGFMHVRISTWFPFTIQVYVNGHEWLARRLDRRNIKYRKIDNAFVWVEDCLRAQRIADEFVKLNWRHILSLWARKANPLLKDLLKAMDYYWVIEQSEFATDVMFVNQAALQSLYQELVKRATLCFTAEDILSFLGRKLNGHFLGDVLTDFKKRWFATRVKHRMKNNCIKMYDKHGCVLRIETVINHPYEFKVRRNGKKKGKVITGWFPMIKGIAHFFRYLEVSRASNHRYLDALAALNVFETISPKLDAFAQPVHANQRSYRGFNPLSLKDISLFRAVMRGEYAILGFRNSDVRHHLFPDTSNHDEIRRQSSAISRLLKILHMHSLVAKIPRSRRWRVTQKGHSLMSMCLDLHYSKFKQSPNNIAA